MEGSGYKVPLTQILEIKEHPNADRLELAIVYGFEVVVGKGSYEPGDEVLYIPIDSVLPKKLEDHIFPEGSKINLHNHRVRQIRIRKFPSQGMLINPEDITMVYGFMVDDLEKDYAKKLDIQKYEPPAKFQSEMSGGKKRIKRYENPMFLKYGGINNIKWFPTKFANGEEVRVTEKIHGTSVKVGILPYRANTLWRKILKLFKLAPKWEYCYGSNNVQIQDRKNYKGFYGDNVYGRVLKDVNAFNKINPGETVYGEIYGSGIQKGYTYGCKEGEQRLVIFDVRVLQPDGTQKLLGPDEVAAFAVMRGFEVVPELYRGPFSMDKMKQLTKGNSVLSKKQPIREGIVIKAAKDYFDKMHGKKALKFISEKYLDKNNTDFH